MIMPSDEQVREELARDAEETAKVAASQRKAEADEQRRQDEGKTR